MQKLSVVQLLFINFYVFYHFQTIITIIKKTKIVDNSYGK